MSEVSAANVTNWLNRMIGRFRDRQCRRSKHRWKERTHKGERLIYYLRTCEHCGLEQIKSDGPMGHRAWHSLKDYNWKWDWEKADF